MHLVYELPIAPLRLSASARGLLRLIYINSGILKVNAAALSTLPVRGGSLGICHSLPQNGIKTCLITLPTLLKPRNYIGI